MTQTGLSNQTTCSYLDPVLHRVRLLARRRLLWLQDILHVSSENRMLSPADQDLAILLNDTDNPHDEAQWHEGHPLTLEIKQLTEQIQQDQDSRLAYICRVFALDEMEIHVLHLTLAQALDPSMGRLFSYLHDDPRHACVTPYLVARLCLGQRFLHWGRNSSLARWQIIRQDYTSLNPQFNALRLDDTIRDWLLGDDALDPSLLDVARLIAPLAPLQEWQVRQTAQQIQTRLEQDSTTTVLVQIIGDQHSGKKTFAACVSAELGLPALFIDHTSQDPLSPEIHSNLFIHAQRHAFLHRTTLIWRSAPLHWLPSIGHFPVQFILSEAESIPAPLPGTTLLTVRMPIPSVATRLALWRRYAPGIAAASPQALDALAHQRRVHVGEIARAVSQPRGTLDSIVQQLNSGQQNVLGNLAQRLESPYTWDDLILPEHLQTILHDFIFEARERHQLWEHDRFAKAFPQGQGLIALFNGASGTGKTMAAQVIARCLDLDIYRIDLSTVVSKYIGETAYNLQQIIRRAETMDAILFFDEADALFSRRTEVHDSHDRYANMDTNYLLQNLETYRGIAILATNRKDNIDPAFIRRLRYVIEFPRPDPSQRYALWRHWLAVLTDDATVSRLDEFLRHLAQHQEATGSQIKFALLSAILAARRAGQPVDDTHLLHGLNREFGKEGRAFSHRELEHLLQNPCHPNGRQRGG
ncbi:MAG: ATP-binding protein [bacterium]|jgi:hypothetical protein